MNERQSRAFRQFVAAGYSKEGAAALIGNACQESGPELRTYFPPSARDHGSNGIFQWRLGRLGHLIVFCEQLELHSGTLEAQVKFAIFELGKDYPYLDARLRRGCDLSELTQEVCWQYLRPAKTAAALDRRISYAKKIFLDAQLENNTHGAAAAGAGAIIAAIAAHAHSVQAPWVLTIVIVGLILCAAVISAMTHNDEKSMVEQEQQTIASPMDELRDAINDFNSAAERLRVAIGAYDARRAGMLGELPGWALSAVSACANPAAPVVSANWRPDTKPATQEKG
jgi:hypothetical protein